MLEVSIEAIEGQIEKFSTQIAGFEAELALAEEKIARAKRERELWQSILALRRPIHGPARPATVPPTVDAEEYGAKSRVMKAHILSSTDLGVTPKSVQEEMAKQGLPVSINFVYKTLKRLQADGEIESIGGVWRPVQQRAA